MINDTFICPSFKVSMPADRQIGFCAIQFRKGREICVDCDRGKAAADIDSATIRENINERPALYNEALTRVNEIKKSKRKEENMGTAVTGTKVCVDCKEEYKPTSNVQKRCPKCKASKKPAPKKAKTKAGRQDPPAKKTVTASSAGKRHNNGCAGCELARAREVLIACGVVSREKFERAEELAKILSR